RKKLQLDEQNLNDDPANAQARGDVAYSRSRIGELLAAKRDYSEALSQERKALEFCEKLSADSPRDVHMRYRTAIVGGFIAELYAKLGNREQALAACGKVLGDRKSTRLNSSHVAISYAVFCLKKKKKKRHK